MSRTSRPPEIDDTEAWGDVVERGKEAPANVPDRGDRRRMRMEHYRAPLKIKTPDVPEELRKKWFGMPPRKLEVQKRGGPISF